MKSTTTDDSAEARPARGWDAVVAWASTSAGARKANGTVVMLLVVGALVGWGALWLEDRAHPPTCYGIGWGCTPGPATSMFFIGWYLLLPSLVVSTATIWLGRRLAASEAPRRHIGAVLVLLPMVVHAVALIVLVVATVAALPDWLAATR